MTSDAVVGTEDHLVRSGVRRAGKRLVPLLILCTSSTTWTG